MSSASSGSSGGVGVESCFPHMSDMSRRISKYFSSTSSNQPMSTSCAQSRPGVRAVGYLSGVCAASYIRAADCWAAICPFIHTSSRLMGGCRAMRRGTEQLSTAVAEQVRDPNLPVEIQICLPCMMTVQLLRGRILNHLPSSMPRPLQQQRQECSYHM